MLSPRSCSVIYCSRPPRSAGEAEQAAEGDTGTVADSAALSEYPRLTSLSAQLSQDAFQDEFDDALHDLIKRVTASTADVAARACLGSSAGVLTLERVNRAGVMN